MVTLKRHRRESHALSFSSFWFCRTSRRQVHLIFVDSPVVSILLPRSKARDKLNRPGQRGRGCFSMQKILSATVVLRNSHFSCSHGTLFSSHQHPNFTALRSNVFRNTGFGIAVLRTSIELLSIHGHARLRAIARVCRSCDGVDSRWRW